jgi:7-carboxy-7-deazaguanine synthase
MTDTKNSKLKVAEIFYSAQGEGKFVGVPSIFLRTFGCNFTCGGFGMARGTCSTERNEVKVELYKSYLDLPLVSTGCDSYASWDPRFKHLSPTYTTDEVVEKMLALVPGNNWQQANGNNVHLVITGGEPLLGWQRAYTKLLKHDAMQSISNITFETNGTQELHADLIEYFAGWTNSTREVTFAVSAKLSASGEKWEDAVKPEIVCSYEKVGKVFLKFVVEKPDDFDEVDRAVKAYRDAGFTGLVYVMPVGGVDSVYNGTRFKVADEAMLRGYCYSPRLQIDLWGNAWAK